MAAQRIRRGKRARSAKSVRINILGGGSFRWPGARKIDAQTFEKILWREVAARTRCGPAVPPTAQVRGPAS
jgi:hypothetical protein